MSRMAQKPARMLRAWAAIRSRRARTAWTMASSLWLAASRSSLTTR